MKSLKKTVIALTLLLSIGAANAQIQNPKTETIKVYGNCAMCKSTIEKAGNLKNTALVNWDSDTKMATLTYDAKKTNQEEVLKRIALSGYDNEKFLSPDAAYSKLPGCCQYERKAKVAENTTVKTEMAPMENHTAHSMNSESLKTEQNQLKVVFDSYFQLKDALIKTDSKLASDKSNDLALAIAAVKMETLTTEEHSVWMKVNTDLIAQAKSIAATQDIKKQRELFKLVSKNTYDLIKVSKAAFPVYYQYCPMQDANWLSKESAVKNPYYGSKMLSCGKVVETIK